MKAESGPRTAPWTYPEPGGLRYLGLLESENTTITLLRYNS